MIKKPDLDSNENDLIDFVHAWVKLCAEGNIIEAFSILDKNIDDAKYF